MTLNMEVTIVCHANILTSLVIVVCPVTKRKTLFFVYIYIKQFTTEENVSFFLRKKVQECSC
jgi:hypothetical protein